MTANYQYSRSNGENLPLLIQIQLSQKPKIYADVFIAFLQSTLNLEHFEKNIHIASVFLKLLTKDVLTKCMAGLLSANPRAMKMLTSPKNCSNLHKSTFMLLFHHSGPNCVRKSHFWSDLKFWDCLLTRRLPTTSILVVIGRSYRH